MVAINTPPASLPSPPLSPARAAQRDLTRQEAQYDEGLVRRFKAGDETAFVEIVTRYRVKMLAVAHTMLRNHADAEGRELPGPLSAGAFQAVKKAVFIS